MRDPLEKYCQAKSGCNKNNISGKQATLINLAQKWFDWLIPTNNGDVKTLRFKQTYTVEI